ncbi:MAG: hypothetical protein D6696_07085 [Acidobacteria bacterium]|nr:MAG: hypothetical protein D6696_07085 [Acidobacteriota bacterium]
MAERRIVIGLNAVILAVTDEEPRVLTVPPPPAGDADALPFGPLDAERDRTLELAVRGWVREQTGLELGYVEQLYTFGDRNRDPREREGGPRVISIGYLSLVREGRTDAAGVRWRGWYGYLPWEDWRDGRPPLFERVLEPALEAWVAAAEGELRRQRRERVDIAFGLGGAPWDGERVLHRYELLYEAGLVAEALRDRGTGDPEVARRLGRPMAFDHRRILATAVGRMRGKIRYRPVVFELVPPTFTLFQLQRVVEALAGMRLHKQNFRRLVEKGGLVEGTGKLTADTGGRPAELFRFRREVLRERPTLGVGLPALPRG